ncbi:hypothetical protein [Persephonella sp.]
MFKKGLIVSLFLFSISFGDILYLNKSGYSTYIQEEEFMVADGENIVGPIFLKPIAKTDSILIEAEGIKIEGYFLENVNKNWKKNIIGKFISIEGEGRVVKGTVLDIEDNYIKLDTKKGYVVTTLPEFPSRLRSPLKWNELFSPQVTLKIKSGVAQTQIFKISYPVEGLSWKAEYILDIKNNHKKLYGFINIKNETAVEFKNVQVVLMDKDYRKDLKEIHINSFGEKKLKLFEKEMKDKEMLDLPDGKVAVYKNGIFIGYKYLKDGILH